MYYRDKPKVFVRFFPGGSGNFFSLLLHSLVEKIDLNRKFSGHIYSSHVRSGNDFKNQYNGGTTHKNFQYHTSGAGDLSEAILYLKNNFRFTETENRIYTIPTHAMNPKSLMSTFTPARYNSKLINLSITEADKEQLHYNMITKDIIPNKRRYLMTIALDYFKDKYPEKVKNPKFNIDNEDFFDDERFIWYLTKFNADRPNSFFKRYSEVTLGDGYDYLDLPFTSIEDLSMFDQLETIADYIGVPLTPENKMQCKLMLIAYKSAQQENPHKDIHIDDY